MAAQTESLPNTDQDRLVRTVALFSVLAHARHNNDFRDAADAQAELENLGVVVRFRRKRKEAISAAS